MRRLLFFASICFAAVPGIAVAQPRALGHTVRWDLTRIQQGIALAGGADMATDAATGDTFTLTGSGDAEPAEGDATGGGTIVHHFAATNSDATAVYVVTGFISWQPAGGQLPRTDGIGHSSEASAGVLKMTIRIFRSAGGFADAILTVNCHLPGATMDVEEGIALQVGKFNAMPSGGVTLFHVQK